MYCARLSRTESNDLYAMVLQDNDTKAMRTLCMHDLFFLLTIAMRRKDVNRDWLYDRCREVEASPNGHLDLWAREHYKSTIITFAKSIQDILLDPNVTIGIFSHTRPIAKGFLNQIKLELENNVFLQSLFPECLYKDPQNESSRWSLDNGIIVKRTQNPKESTVEAWGLVDGQPTSKHFSRLVYDDVVTLESVTTPEQIQKVTDSWAMSLNLGASGGVKRYIGTRYHYNDTYREIIERDVAKPRIHKATKDGTPEGEPVFLSREDIIDKRKAMGPYIFASQMLQDPTADKAMSFKQEWLMYYDEIKGIETWNKYVLVDPASQKKKSSDYTIIKVIALAPDNNYYLLDAVRDRLNLTERTRKLFQLVKKYRPIKVGYEHYGMQADIEHIKYVQEQENYRFKIIPLGGQIPKNDRIKRLIPIFEQHRFYLPRKLMYKDAEGKARDYVSEFTKDEYLSFPISIHDDMLDACSRIVDEDLGASFPELDTGFGEGRVKEHDTVETDYDLFA